VCTIHYTVSAPENSDNYYYNIWSGQTITEESRAILTVENTRLSKRVQIQTVKNYFHVFFYDSVFNDPAFFVGVEKWLH
jgi:hypothetical protein